MSLSRRETLAWMAAAFAAIPAVPTAAWADTPLPAGLDPRIGWPDVALPVNAAMGYGTDPDLTNPTVPWPLILTAEQRRTLNQIGDIVLPPDADGPGAGEIDIAAFIDEWISSPYEAQAPDRRRVINGLAWLDSQSRHLSKKPFATTDQRTQSAIIDALMLDPVPKPLGPAADFFGRLRGLIVGGYYTTPQGKAAIGYQGNTPMTDYPGPSEEALAHLRGLLKDLKLPVKV